MIYFNASRNRNIYCDINYYANEPVYHPDRIVDIYDFLYIQDGTWDIWEEDVVYHVKNGDLLILEPGRHHFSLEKCSPGMRNMFLHCDPSPADILSHPFSNDSPEDSPSILLHPPMTSEHFCLQKLTNCSGSPQIENLFLQMIKMHWSNSAHRSLCLESLFFLFLAELEKAGSPSVHHDSLIEEIIHQFYLHTNRFLSPQELADTYHISIRTLSERFKRTMGVSIHQYQINLKLDFAREQLHLNPDRRLRELALNLGFYDEFHFSKLFKRKFGYSPSSLRKNQ